MGGGVEREEGGAVSWSAMGIVLVMGKRVWVFERVFFDEVTHGVTVRCVEI